MSQSRQKILYQDSQSMELLHPPLMQHLLQVDTFFLGGSGSSFGTQFTGSLMEYRLWSEPLSQSIFDNHVSVPKNIMEIIIHHHTTNY